MNRFFEGVHSIGYLKPSPIVINTSNVFDSVSKSFGEVAKNINKAIRECNKNGRSTGKISG